MPRILNILLFFRRILGYQFQSDHRVELHHQPTEDQLKLSFHKLIFFLLGRVALLLVKHRGRRRWLLFTGIYALPGLKFSLI